MKLLEHCPGYGHLLKAPLNSGCYWMCARCGFHPEPTKGRYAEVWNDAVVKDRSRFPKMEDYL